MPGRVIRGMLNPKDVRWKSHVRWKACILYIAFEYPCATREPAAVHYQGQRKQPAAMTPLFRASACHLVNALASAFQK